MNKQEHLNPFINLIQAHRDLRMKDSDQFTIGKILDAISPILKRIPEIIEKYGDPPNVMFDFEYLFPTGVHSWRGSYAELALDFAGLHEGKDPMPLADFYKMMEDCVGKTFQGYKGGDYTMSRDTPVWVAKHNHSGETAVIGVVDQEHTVYLITGLRPF